MLPILNQSYWRDEAFSILLALKSLPDLLSTAIQDANLPLYYVILHFWIKWFGDAEYATRSLSLIFHILLVITSIFILQHFIKNWKLSALSSLAILLNPFMISYAFETRGYTLFSFLIAISTLLFLKKKYFTTSLFLTLAIFTHNFSLLFFAAFLAYWLYDITQRKEGIKTKILQSLSLFTLPILIALSWLTVLWNQWIKLAGGFWIEPKTSSILVDAFRVYFRGYQDYPSRGMLYNITLALVFLGISHWVVKVIIKEDKNQKDSTLLAFLFSIPFLLTYTISMLWLPIFHERYIIPILPLFIIWTAISLFKLSKLSKSISYVIFALFISYLLFAVQSTEEIVRKTIRPPINYSVQQILSKAEPEDVIIPESPLNFLETKYYVLKSEKTNPVYTYSPGGKKDIPYYIGSILYSEEEVITDYPKDKNIWIVQADGGHYLKQQ